MATNDKWIGTSGDWSNPANWSTGIPNSGNNAVISTTTVQTVTHNSGNDTVASILANGNVAFQMNGGSLDSLGNATFNGSYRQTGGVIQSGGTLTIALKAG